MLHLRLVLLVWFFQVQLVVGTLINVTIDDTNPGVGGSTITYFPDGAWNLGTDCNGCTAHPDVSQLFDGTWHDGTFNPLPGSNNFPNQTLTASVTFNGTAVYVFCVLARTTTSPDGDSDMTFVIDGETVGTFVKAAPGTTGYDYNVSVFSTSTLLPGNHTLTIQNGHVNGNKSLVILDSIVYSFDDGVSDSSSSSSNTSRSGIIAVAVVVPVVVVGLAIAAAIFYCRRRRRQQSIHDDRTNINPFNPPVGTARLPASASSISPAARIHAKAMSTNTSSTLSRLTSTSGSGSGKSTPNRPADGAIHRAQQPLAVKGLVRQNLSPDVSTPEVVHSTVATFPPASSSGLIDAGAITLEDDMYPDEAPPAYA